MVSQNRRDRNRIDFTVNPVADRSIKLNGETNKKRLGANLSTAICYIHGYIRFLVWPDGPGLINFGPIVCSLSPGGA